MKNLFNMLQSNVSAYYDLAGMILLGVLTLGLAPMIIMMAQL